MAMPAKLRADLFFERSLKLVAGVSVVSLTAIVVFLCAQAFPAFKEMSLTDFLFSTEWYPTDDEPSFGIGALIVGSLACALLTTLIAVPLGVLTAACMHCGMHEKIRRFVKPLIELMAALPSVVIGFIGMVVLAPWLQQTFALAAADLPQRVGSQPHERGSDARLHVHPDDRVDFRRRPQKRAQRPA